VPRFGVFAALIAQPGASAEERERHLCEPGGNSATQPPKSDTYESYEHESLGLDKSFIYWPHEYTVNLIQHLFGRHRQAEGPSAVLFNWPGQSGKEYQYEVFPLDAGFQPLAGNYIYARQTEDGGWVPVYIAQTRDLHQRLEGHVRMEDAIQNGATHLHAHYCAVGQAGRCSEERDLILRWQPVCNERVEDS